MNILGINYGHDASVCLLRDDKIEYAKIKDMQIEIIDDYLNTDVHDEIKITKM